VECATAAHSTHGYRCCHPGKAGVANGQEPALPSFSSSFKLGFTLNGPNPGPKSQELRATSCL